MLKPNIVLHRPYISARLRCAFYNTGRNSILENGLYEYTQSFEMMNIFSFLALSLALLWLLVKKRKSDSTTQETEIGSKAPTILHDMKGSISSKIDTPSFQIMNRRIS